MNTIKFIVVVSMSLLTVDLIYHQVVNGQSLEGLQNQVDQDARYRAELFGYFAQHNVTTEWVDDISTLALEEAVKEHMELCQTGQHDQIEQLIKDFGTKDEKGILHYDTGDDYLTLGDLGDC